MRSLIDLVNDIPDPVKAAETEVYLGFGSRSIITVGRVNDLSRVTVPDKSVVYCLENSKVYVYFNDENLMPTFREVCLP